MTDSEKLTMLSAMTGETDQTVLSTYLILAGDKVCRKAYPFHPNKRTVPSEYDSVHVEIAAYMLNKRGAEGQKSHNENGISRTYETGDVPHSLMRQITPYAGAVNTAEEDENDLPSESESEGDEP